MKFKLKSQFKPAGGQPEAIKKLVDGYSKYPAQTLLGITGSGKTFVMANLIEQVQKPTLILAHNKTLAAQLYQELKELFPQNKVEYFISYYDYYQPESYLPTSDTYIEKDSSVNSQIEVMRLKSMASLLARNDTIVVASISCIYGLGDPADFAYLSLQLKKLDAIPRDKIISHLIEMQYERNKDTLEPGQFRVRGDVIDIIPKYDTQIIRIELYGDEIERLQEVDHVTGEVISHLDEIKIFPAKQYVVPEEKIKKALGNIRTELKQRVIELPELERQRIEQRTKYDLEMIEELGYCSGIENYSRHFEGRAPGSAPKTLLHFFPEEFLLIIDESHQSIPQSNAMYKGDFARKKNLVDFGFRLPSAFDNRPLKFAEFEKFFKHAVFVSATPGPYEKEHAGQEIELIIRPTGLIDPTVEVKPSQGQIPDLIQECKKTIANGNRVLVTTLTKRMAEDLTNYLAGEDLNVRYMHSDIDSLDRIELIRQLRSGEFDILVGINLLREGLDLPEVSLVAILDADKEGFLRNETSFIQTIGRAARNVNGRVIMYADKMTKSMESAIDITSKRRAAQVKYNFENNITPTTISKKVAEKGREIKGHKHMAKDDIIKKLADLEAQMMKAAEELDFEKAIDLRDTLERLKREI